jgi:hypothetical protein
VKSAFLFLFLSLSLHVVVAQDEYDSTAVVVEEEYVQTDSIAAILDDDDINPMHGTNDFTTSFKNLQRSVKHFGNRYFAGLLNSLGLYGMCQPIQTGESSLRI